MTHNHATPTTSRVALLHGAGYAGGELIRLLLAHPAATLAAVTSRTFAGQPVWSTHPTLRGQTDLLFTDPEHFDPAGLDAVLITAENPSQFPWSQSKKSRSEYCALINSSNFFLHLYFFVFAVSVFKKPNRSAISCIDISSK
jgi:hypothetical protein